MPITGCPRPSGSLATAKPLKGWCSRLPSSHSRQDTGNPDLEALRGCSDRGGVRAQQDAATALQTLPDCPPSVQAPGGGRLSAYESAQRGTRDTTEQKLCPELGPVCSLSHLRECPHHHRFPSQTHAAPHPLCPTSNLPLSPAHATSQTLRLHPSLSSPNQLDSRKPSPPLWTAVKSLSPVTLPCTPPLSTHTIRTQI